MIDLTRVQEHRPTAPTVGVELVELYRALVDAAPDALIVVDAAGSIRIANRQAETVFGYRLDELLGLSLAALVPEATLGSTRRTAKGTWPTCSFA